MCATSREICNNEESVKYLGVNYYTKLQMAT